MSEFTIKTNQNRNLVIEADKYTRTKEAVEFYKDGGSVATVFPFDLLAIVKDGAEAADYYASDRELDDSFIDPTATQCPVEEGCLDCLLGSEEFFNAVYDIVDVYHEPDSEDPTPAVPPVPTSPVVPKVETRKHNGRTLYGFVVPEDRFVHFSSPESARMGSHQYAYGTRGWSTFPLSETELVEEGA